MARSLKSIAGAVGATLGNAPYSDSDRTALETRSFSHSGNRPVQLPRTAFLVGDHELDRDHISRSLRHRVRREDR
ncbi:hypothetical protein [Microcystis aeruginosa]|uniref:hypothetical protein n=1 Tax=Microcystis aeruginosa TaxID=1126 RepID=UPI0018AD1130|nr:hypothetical protein [Microcystis aeruginosa]